MKSAWMAAVVVTLGLDSLTAGAATHTLPLVLHASNPTLQGFVRVLNLSDRAGTVSILAFDDDGRQFGPVSLSLGAGAVHHFNSTDLERGNADKGLSGGVGDGTGSWRLVLDTTLDIEPLAYIRTADGFVTSMHDVVAPDDRGAYFVRFFNPGSNRNQVSILRIVNPDDDEVSVTIAGTDDRGESPASKVRLSIPAGGGRTLTVQELEEGASGLTGRFGAGSGKWQLSVTADRSIQVVNLLRSPTGHLANLSTGTTTTAVRPRRVECRGGPDDETLIPDPALRGGFEILLNKTSGEPITNAEMATLKGFLHEGQILGKIQDLTGMECAVNFDSLGFENHDITDLSPVAGLPHLKEVWTYGNKITDVTPLAGASSTGISVLWIYNNKITDITPLSELNNLVDLNLGGNGISDITPLAGMSGLIELHLWSNLISDVTPLAGLSELTILSLNENRIRDITPLAALSGLTVLFLHENPISDITPLAGMHSLRLVTLGNSAEPDTFDYDLAPLVANPGFGEGDWVILKERMGYFVSSDSVSALEAKGVQVQFIPDFGDGLDNVLPPDGEQAGRATSTRALLRARAVSR